MLPAYFILLLPTHLILLLSTSVHTYLTSNTYYMYIHMFATSRHLHVLEHACIHVQHPVSYIYSLHLPTYFAIYIHLHVHAAPCVLYIIITSTYIFRHLHTLTRACIHVQHPVPYIYSFHLPTYFAIYIYLHVHAYMCSIPPSCPRSLSLVLCRQ